MVNKQSNLTHWHPVLGWFAQPMDPGLNAAMPHVKIQLNYLWNSSIVQILLGNLLHQLVQNVDSPQASSSPQHNFSSSNFLKKFWKLVAIRRIHKEIIERWGAQKCIVLFWSARYIILL